MSIHEYWDFDSPLEHDVPASRPDKECAEELGVLLDEAVRPRMRADVPVGCYLSGGLDSGSVPGLMGEARVQLRAGFFAEFRSSACDEGPIAQEMADRAGAEFTRIPISHGKMADDLSDALWHGETLFINADSAAKFTLSRVVRDAGYKVVLTVHAETRLFPFFCTRGRRDLTQFSLH